ncbi:kinase-like domain-containing protein, partial [Blastocladiella britannica]
MQFNSTKMKNYTTPGQSPKAPAGTITAIKACLDNLVTVAASEPELLDPTSPLNLVMARARVLLDALSITTPNAALADRLLATLQCVTPTALAIPPGPFKRVYLASGEVATKLTAAANDLEMLAAELDYRAGPLVYPLFDGPDTASAVPTEPRHGRTSTDLGRARLSPDQFNGRTFYLGDELGQLGMANHDGADIDPNFEQRGPTFAPLDCLAVTAADFKMTDVVLGRGGFGEVVQALWLSSGTKVAVKRLLPLKGQLNQDRPIMDTVANEALVWSNLHHPHVLPLLGVCLTSDVPFLVMPHMAGGDLTRYAWGRPHEHLRLLHEASQGMAYLHGKHIFHGDLKGNNILVDGYGRVQISDFGQARMLEEAAGDQSFGVGSVGNVRWIAPERYKRDAEYQLEPDVFAFAMVMYEVASGVVPFHEVKDLSLIVGRMVSGERPSMPSAGAPAYLPLLWPLIEQCWSHDWTTRPTFVEVVAHLARLREMPAMAVRQAIAPTIKPLRHPIAKESDPNLNYEGAIAFDPLMLDILAYVPDAIQPTTAIELPPRVAKIDIFHDMMAPAELAGDRVIWDRRMDLATGALTDLEVNQRPIGLAGLDILQRVWTQPQQRLTKLELKSCNLGPKGADQLAQFLPPTLTYLDLSYNQIGKSSTRTIALKLPLSLTALLLCCNEIGASGATAVAANLPPLLTQLDLAINWFGDEGAVAIAAKLPPSLRILDLEYNYIGDAGAAAIATHLPLPLTVLKLSNNRFGDVGAAAIATHLPLSLTVL